MNYTFHQLRIFKELVRTKSITQAAKNLHMTQPALSIQLKNFQNQFEIPLTELIGKQIYITDFGKEISEVIDGILDQADELQFKTSKYKGLISGKLRISCASTGKYVLPYFLTDFLKIHSGIDLEMDVSNKRSVINDLEENKVDFAVISITPENLDVYEESLLENRMYFIGAEDSLKVDMPLIYREKGSATRMAMDKFFENSSERKSINLTSNEAVKQAVVAGLGKSILPIISLKHELEKGLVQIIPTKGLPFITQWKIVWLKKKKLSPVAQEYLSYLKENKEDISKKEFNWYFNRLDKISKFNPNNK